MTERDPQDPQAPDAPPHLAGATRGPNRLIREKSPYLLQHARNPVDWFPWGEEAFARARAESRPIFLSIGYSTCHWCHVMERESFEDEAVAALLNAHFVPIKVDREERPDVDRLYLTAAQAMGLGGGWPLNLFLTPALEPFYGGTYFPPVERYGRPAFRQVLESIRGAWTEQRARIEESGGRVLAVLASLAAPAGAGGADPVAQPGSGELFAEAFEHLEQTHDARAGGFGSAPKFPSVANLDFLLRFWSRDRDSRGTALERVVRQLDAMRAGGLHDHLGGGFHRYSTDAQWRVPHFEKMLYDQAQLAWVYLDAHQATGRPEYAATARGILEYVARDLTSPEGAFYSAEDADSEGEEGRFYVWTPAESAAVLGAADAPLFDFVHGVTPQGNFEHGASVLHLAHTTAGAARRFGLPEPEARRRLAAARARLLEARGRRVRPHRDDKVLTAWNGLMISAFARGARVLRDPVLAERAGRAAEFVWTALRDGGTGELRRRWREGETAGAGQLADHAAYAIGCVDLYQATHDPRWLERAVAVTGVMIERFRDPQAGGFFESPPGDPSIRVRMKDGFDGAEIAGNSLAAYAVQTLGALLGRRGWLEEAERAFGYYRRRLAGSAYAMPRMLVAMDLAAGPARHVVVAGDPEAAGTRALIHEFDRRFLPRDLLLVADGAERSRRLADLAPFAAALTPQNGRPAAYVCVDHACRLPVTDARAFAALLDEGT
jgi:uncharacterized protein YyaL (SSP411 family)